MSEERRMSMVTNSGVDVMDGWTPIGNGYYFKDETSILSGNLTVLKNASTDPILREIVEETIQKSHNQWRSIPETAFLVLKAIEDYKC